MSWINLLNRMPAGGLALHGTSLEGARNIARDGLNRLANPNVIGGVSSPYIVVLPSRSSFDYSAIRPEIRERTIGTVLFAAIYSMKRFQVPDDFFSNSKPVKTASLPSIVLFQGDVNVDGVLFTPGYDEECLRPRFKGHWRPVEYRSFGKRPEAVPARQVKTIVHLTKKEIRGLQEDCRNKPEPEMHFWRSSKAKLVAKTLRAIRAFIESDAA